MVKFAVRFVVIALILLTLSVVGGQAKARSRIPMPVIQGEAGNCSIGAKYAVANLWHRNDIMYGWDNEIDAETYEVWINYKQVPDRWPESRFLFSSSDLEDDRVIKLVRGLNRPPHAIFLCGGGTALFLY